MECRRCNATLPNSFLGKHRYCNPCFFVYRTNTHGWQRHEKLALDSISTYLRKRELNRHSNRLFKAIKHTEQKKQEQDACSTSTTDSSTNTLPDPKQWPSTDLGPHETIKTLSQRLELHSHDHQWLREHSLQTLGRLTERLHAVEYYIGLHRR
jgi:hypothetical protein